MALFASVPQQVRRLSVVVVVLVAALIVARLVLVPRTFGEKGHYRAAAVDTIAALPLRYAGHDACEMCHAQVAATKAASFHRPVACEVCHGPASDHMANPVAVKPPAPRDRSFCPRCHAFNAARPTGFPQIDTTRHNPGIPCYMCHRPHDPTPPRPPESCGACHGMIERTKAVSPHAALACTICHAADSRHKLAPRQYLPTKPAGREFCGRCHAQGAMPPDSLPAGIRIPRVDLATHGERYVCWQCHYPHHPEAR